MATSSVVVATTRRGTAMIEVGSFWSGIEILLLPLLAGAGIALLVGPLGCVVVWQRMAYFGESLAHSALFGVALGIWLDVAPVWTVILAGAGLAVLLAGLQHASGFSADTLLGILSHTLLAGGLVVLSCLPGQRVNLESLLFGDLLAVSAQDVWLLYALVLPLAAGLYRLWQPLVAITVHEELAAAEGVPVARVRLMFLLVMAVTVAVAMKVTGVLLMTSLLVIPAAIAHASSRSPEQMAVLAVLIALLAVAGGLALSWLGNTPVGPSVVLVAGLFFLNASLVRHWRRRAA